MDDVKGIKWLVKLANFLLLLLCTFLIMKLSPIWLPILQISAKVLIPFLVAGLITYLLHPIIEKLQELGLPRFLAVLLIYLLFFGGVGYTVVTGTPYLINQLRAVLQELPVYVETVQSWIDWFNQTVATLPIGVQNYLNEWLGSLEGKMEEGIDNIIEVLMQIINSFIYFIVIPFLAFYLLKDYQLLEKVSWYVTPRKWRKSGKLLLKDIDQSFGSFIRGQILVSICAGILSMIGFWLIGLPYPILLGLFVGITDIIPYFGAFLGAVPAIIVAGLHSWKMVLFTAGVIFVIQQIEGNILSPIIVGRTLKLHPILIIFALIVGIEIGGIFGLLFAVPLLAIAKTTLLHIRSNLHKD